MGVEVHPEDGIEIVLGHWHLFIELGYLHIKVGTYSGHYALNRGAC